MKDNSSLLKTLGKVLDYVARGEVSAGMVYATDAIKVERVKIAMRLPNKATSRWYPIAVIKGSKKENLGKALFRCFSEGNKL
jgi:molybdate transport system substrate-binding protein